MENNIFNIEAEQAILGTIILNNEYLKRVEDILEPKHFYETAHQAIYDRILSFKKDNICGNQVTLKVFCDSDPLVISVGGASYLSVLLGAASAIIDIRDYANLVVEYWKQRDLLDAVQLTKGKSYQEIKAEIKKRLDEHEINSESDLRTINDVSLQMLQEEEEVLTFGIRSLDRFLGGIDAGNLIILAGRPSMGKTTYSVNLAMAASLKYIVIFFTLEVKDKAIARKVVGNLRSYTTSHLKQNKLSKNEVQEVFSDGFFRDTKLLLSDSPRQTTSKIRSKIVKAVKKGLKMVFIDYLGMILCDKKTWSKANEIEIVVNELKAIALEFNIAIILLCQLNRSLESRASHKPVLSDLRDSGAIEQTADIVMFIHREEYYLSKAKPFKKNEIEEWEIDMREVRGKSQIIVAKNRDGETGEVEMLFDGKFSRFTEIDNNTF